MTQGLWYFCAKCADAFGGGRNVWYRLFAASVGERRIKKKGRMEKETKKKRSYAQDETTRDAEIKRECKEREKRKDKEKEWVRRGRGREWNDRQKRLSQRQNESETNKIGWTRRESWRCRGTLVVLASMGKGQQIHWPRGTPVSTEVSFSPFLLYPSHPHGHYTIVSLRSSRGPTHARAAILTCVPPASRFPSDAITRLAVESKRIALFASRLLIRGGDGGRSTGGEQHKKYYDFRFAGEFYDCSYNMM